MKKICISFLLLAIIILTVGCDGSLKNSNGYTNNQEFLRIHVRANSNEEKDQIVKYKIKDLVVNWLTPYVSNCHSKDDTAKLINRKKRDLECIIDEVLKANGFKYSSHVGIKNEKFPTRVYEGITLESGYYDAVIVELGEAKGDNWWCVVYPPLCFTSGESVKYKSKILEIIEDFLNRKKYNAKHKTEN